MNGNNLPYSVNIKIAIRQHMFKIKKQSNKIGVKIEEKL